VIGLTLAPGGVIAWIVIGLLAGAIAGRLTRGRGYGCLFDIVVGLVGAFIGGMILSAFVDGNKTEGFLGTLGVAILGALALLLSVRLIRSIF
jgi:uncharacterized membrane protein YeaQ/YmgE (transglycosylase-associated protein family)